MRLPDLTPPVQLHLPDGILAEYIAGSNPPAYRLDSIGMALPVDVIIPEDLAAAGWYWHGSTLAWNGDDRGGPIGISTAVYPPPGWLSRRRNCFEAARIAEQADAVRCATSELLRSRPEKTEVTRRTMPAATIQLAMSSEGR